MAEVENSTITNEEFKYINKNYIMDIDFTDGGVGDKKNTSEKILIKGEKGYALSGIQYVYNLPTGEQEPYRDVYCDKPIRQIVFAFDSIYNENKPTLYHYINNGTPSVSQQNPLPIEQCYSYNMGSSRNNRLFISNFVFLIVFILGVIGLNNLKVSTVFKIFSKDITIDNNTFQLFLFILYIIIFIISWVMLSNSIQLFQMRTGKLFADE
jgi:hypothetical protein